jgi:hypothetical protein
VERDGVADQGQERSFEDRYRDLSEIGRGGYSVVYRAFSPEFNREVAVKIFDGHVTDADIRRRFRLECQVIGTLGDHPHVVSVFDSGFTADGKPYLVMAYCAGGSFWQRIAGQGPRTPAEATFVGLALADALDAAHARGIVHRDVKPQNVLLTGYGVVALADFGVATAPTGELRSFAATPGYVAPEVVLGDGNGGSGGPAADVFSVGATLYALLTGGPPVRPDIGEPETAYLFRCVDSPVPPLPLAVPPALARVILECLEKDPGARPAGAASLRRRLRLAAVEDGLELPERLEPLPVPASMAPLAGAVDRNATTEPESPPVWPRRLAAACLAAAFVGGGVAGGAWLASADRGPGGPLASLPGVSDGGPSAPPGSVGAQRPSSGEETGDGTSDGTRDGTGDPGTGPADVPVGGDPTGDGGQPTSAPPSAAPTAEPTAEPTTTVDPTETVDQKGKKPKKPKPTKSAGADDASEQ